MRKEKVKEFFQNSQKLTFAARFPKTWPPGRFVYNKQDSGKHYLRYGFAVGKDRDKELAIKSFTYDFLYKTTFSYVCEDFDFNEFLQLMAFYDLAVEISVSQDIMTAVVRPSIQQQCPALSVSIVSRNACRLLERLFLEIARSDEKFLYELSTDLCDYVSGFRQNFADDLKSSLV